MKINTMWKQYITEAFLKTVIRTPSQFSLPPSTTRTALDQLCRFFPVNKEVHIRPIRLAGIKAEEIKPQSSSTQLIFHIHGGAFF